MHVENHRLKDVPFDATPHMGREITPRFLVMHYTAGGSALNSVRAIRDRGLSAHLSIATAPSSRPCPAIARRIMPARRIGAGMTG